MELNQICECSKSELDIFQMRPIVTTLESAKWELFQPVSSLSDSGPIEFYVSGSADRYLDLTQSYLSIKVKLVKLDRNGDEKTLEANDLIAPANNLLHTMFSQVDVFLNGKRVSDSNENYAFRSYIETLLNYGSDAASSHLQLAGWKIDDAGEFDNIADTNLGFQARRRMMEQSKMVQLIGRIHSDMFLQDRFLLGSVDLRVRLQRSKDAFAIMAVEGVRPKLKIMLANLFVCKVIPSADLLVAHAVTLRQTSKKYPIRRVVCKTFTAPSGVMSIDRDNIFIGQLPTRVLFAFVPNDAYNGVVHKNPFKFDNNNTTYATCYINGEEVTTSPIRPSFSDDIYSDAYFSLFSGTGALFKDRGYLINKTQFRHGTTLFAWDFMPDLADSEHHYPTCTGSLRVVFHFAQALAATTNVICYAEFDNTIEIGSDFNVLTDY